MMVLLFTSIFWFTFMNAFMANEVVLMSDKYLSEERENLCPDAVEIFPCTCSADIGNNDRLSIDCSEVTTTEMLQNIFQKPFPSDTFYQFDMNQDGFASSMTELNSGVFGTKTFIRVYIHHINFNVSEDVFDGMEDTLEYLDFYDVPFTKYDKIFNSFKKLNYLNIFTSLIEEIFIQSSTLDALYVTSSRLTERSDNLSYNLGLMQNLGQLYLMNNYLTKNPSTAGYPILHYIQWESNDISLIETQSMTRNYLQYFNANSNGLTDIEEDSIRMSTDGILYLEYNSLTNLDSAKYENIFKNASRVLLRNNPFECGCDIAWLITNPTYMEKLDSGVTQSTACANRTKFVELDPNAFDHC